MDGWIYWVPLGIHGMALVFPLAPLGFTLAKTLDLWMVTPTFALTVLPVGLINKHLVGFFNRFLQL